MKGGFDAGVSGSNSSTTHWPLLIITIFAIHNKFAPFSLRYIIGGLACMPLHLLLRFTQLYEFDPTNPC